MEFHKYHGLGNDFVLVDEENLPVGFGAEMARLLCDRHTGVGADGVLVVGRPPRKGVHAQMTVYNPDGSIAEMCGNGIRCVVYHLARHHHRKEQELSVLTGAGVKTCRVVGYDGRKPLISVAMGPVSFESPDLPKADSADGTVGLPLWNGGEVRVVPVSVGNPHAVCRIPAGEAVMVAATHLGPLVEAHSAFPRHTNAEFVHVVDETSYEVVVYERGAGITMACGSGATAVAACAVANWGAPKGADLRVILPGGPLTLNVQDGGKVTMTGSATYVFSGRWDW